MRAIAVVVIGASVAGAFFLGRASQPTPAAAAASGKVLTAAKGDALRIPGIRTRCVVSAEGGATDLLCDHTPRGRYELVLFSDELFVYRNGHPDNPRFVVRWKP